MESKIFYLLFVISKGIHTKEMLIMDNLHNVIDKMRFFYIE